VIVEDSSDSDSEDDSNVVYVKRRSTNKTKAKTANEDKPKESIVPEPVMRFYGRIFSLI
jgi:hypothetical protein